MSSRTKAIPAPAETINLVAEIIMNHRDLYGMNEVQSLLGQDHEPLTVALLKASLKIGNNRTQQGAAAGRKEHPFDLEKVALLQTINEHHATCIHTKVSSTVGLGFRNGSKPKVDPLTGLKDDDEIDEPTEEETLLNPLCEFSFQDTSNDVTEDFVQAGTGYFEVVREGKATSPITNLNHLPAKNLHVYVEKDVKEEDDGTIEYHYVQPIGEGKSDIKYAIFGEKDAMIERNDLQAEADEISEVICIRRPSSLSRWYGFPDWIAAGATIELARCLRQQKYDFFNNRGVPEFMLFILGAKLPPDQWKIITDSLQSNVGLGNQHKSFALNLANSPETMKIQLEKLAMDGGNNSEEFASMTESLAMSIVTAHRVPPLLAGIQIPGKLGATNELPNALRAFQLLVIGPYQRLIRQRLVSTLGNKQVNGGLVLTDKHFKFRRITDELDLDAMDTSARMRETEPEAAKKGRKLSGGLKD